MFERYTQRSRSIVFLARWRAGERGASAIEMGDILTALVIEDQGRLASAVSSLYGDTAMAEPSPQYSFFTSEAANAILKRLEGGLARSRPLPLRADVPLDSRSTAILTEAAKLADELKHREVEPLHLLAAALGEESSDAVQILREAGITPEKAIKALGDGAR